MRDIVLVTVDSLRADHVGWHGYERRTTPNLDQRANSSQTFTQAFAHACSTRPSFPSILTSSYALMYGGFERLSDDRTTIAEELSTGGYETAGFHSNLYLSADFGYDRGFDEFFDSKSDPSPLAKLRQAIKTHIDDESRVYRLLQLMFNATEKRAGIELGSAYVDAEEMTDRALSWAKTASDGPRFIWVHYMDVHHPYVPPAEYQRRFRDQPIEDRRAVQLRREMLQDPDSLSDDEVSDIVDLYDAEIAYMDAEVDRLVTGLRNEWGEDTIFAFTADHGEEFRDHGGFSHRATFHDEVLHVPLFIDDGEMTGVCDDLVGLLDLAPSLVEYADIESPSSFYGNPLQRAGTDAWARSSVIAEWEDTETGGRRFGVRTPSWKYIRKEDESEQLYDLTTDPGETDNVVDSEPEALDELRERLNEHQARLERTEDDLGEVGMDEQTRQRLQDLGYRE